MDFPDEIGCLGTKAEAEFLNENCDENCHENGLLLQGAEELVTDDDDEIDVDELEKRMWRDRIRLRRIKEQQKLKCSMQQGSDRTTNFTQNSRPFSQEQAARRKKMSRAHDGILKYMLKMMEVCKAQAFVYGIIPEKGKPVSGASDNIRAWWKEKVRFDRNGPAAIAMYQTRNSDLLKKKRYANATDGNCDGNDDGNDVITPFSVFASGSSKSMRFSFLI